MPFPDVFHNPRSVSEARRRLTGEYAATAAVRTAVGSCLVLLALVVPAAAPAVAAQTPQELVWAGDSEGGAPYVEADPARPDRVVGFEVEIAALLARGLGRTPRFINITFASIAQSIARGDADLAACSTFSLLAALFSRLLGLWNTSGKGTAQWVIAYRAMFTPSA